MDEKILMCEICREPIGRFNAAELRLPVNLRVFKSLYPERSVPDPFPAALDDWRAAACPRCRRRPFFNFFDKGDGTVVVSTGEALPDGQQWFVMAVGDDGQPEKMLLLPEKGENPPPEQPSETQDCEPDAELSGGEEPTGNYKGLPVACPICGKRFRSKGRLDKYHTPCPSLPPQEGFKI